MMGIEKRRTAEGPTTRIIDTECGVASEGGEAERLVLLRGDIDKDIESSTALVVIIRDLADENELFDEGCKVN
jgi:hypothetical protein